MREELENILYEKFPSILINENGRRCHLDVEDGWYDLITIICVALTSNADTRRSYENLMKKNGTEIKKYIPVKAVQIKEKFGELRFYVSGGDEFDRGVIFTAELMSRKTCEKCGDRAKIDNDEGWLSTLCEKHIEERRWRKENEPKTVLLDSGQMG